MSSEKMILIGVGLFLYLQMTRSQAAAARTSTGYTVPSNNQNADLWIKTGALKLGGQLLQEIGKGSFANIFTPSTGSVDDSFVSIPGSDGYFGDIGFEGGYDLGVGTA